MAQRINRAIAQLERGFPIFYTGGHTGAELTFETGRACADTWADYINVGMEHGPLDLPGLQQFMRGLAAAESDTPAVLVELPFEGSDAVNVRANAWQIRQMLAIGVHGFLLCHAETPEAVQAFVDATRFTFRGGTRGAGGQGAAAEIWRTSADDYMERADPWPLNPDGELLLGLKIENTRALENAEASTAIPGIAFAEWGPADMSMSYGFRATSDDFQRPELVAARDRVFAACRSANIAFLESATAANVADKLAQGVRVFAGADAELAATARDMAAGKV